MNAPAPPFPVRIGTFDVVTRRWSPHVAALYALAVGYGSADPSADLDFTGAHPTVARQRVVPTFANVLAKPSRSPVDSAALADGIVKAGHTMRLLAPIPARGQARCTSEVVGVYDTGDHALVDVVSTVEDLGRGGTLVTTRSETLLLGRGGWGGQPAPADGWRRPVRRPDELVRLVTRPEQALLYSLLGDNHPLHWSPEVADANGFRAPVLHGLATFGVVGRGLAALLPGVEHALPEIGMWFRTPVLPGDDIELHLWREPSRVVFQAVAGNGSIVVDHGTARCPDA